MCWWLEPYATPQGPGRPPVGAKQPHCPWPPAELLQRQGHRACILALQRSQVLCLLLLQPPAPLSLGACYRPQHNPGVQQSELSAHALVERPHVNLLRVPK